MKFAASAEEVVYESYDFGGDASIIDEEGKNTCKQEETHQSGYKKGDENSDENSDDVRKVRFLFTSEEVSNAYTASINEDGKEPRSSNVYTDSINEEGQEPRNCKLKQDEEGKLELSDDEKWIYEEMK